MPNRYARGIDVSHWQSTISWGAVKGDGQSFAFIKATQGLTHVDRQLSANWAEAKSAGIILSAYHFLNPHQDGSAQAEHFIRTMAPHLARHGGYDMPCAVDVETVGSVGNATLRRNLELCLARIEREYGYLPVIYTRASFWNTHLRVDGAYPTWTARYPLWVAHYTNAPQPIIPIGWHTWRFWQFTQTGRTKGVAGNNDHNYFNGSLDDLRRWAAAYLGIAHPNDTLTDPTRGTSTDIPVVQPGDQAPNRTSTTPLTGTAATQPQPGVVHPDTSPVPGASDMTSTPPPRPDTRFQPEPDHGPGPALPAGAIGRWPLDPDGYIEYIYRNHPARPLLNGTDQYGKPYRYKYTTSQQDLAIRYKPLRLTEPGRYLIEAFIPHHHADTTQAGYHIVTYQRGTRTEKRVVIDQSAHDNIWVSLGEYTIDPTRPADGYVNVTDFSTEEPPRLIAFGAIRWRKL